MAFFLVTMTHPDGEGWGVHVAAHVGYLRGLIDQGKIRASGPVTGLGKRAGFIIMTVESLEEAQRLVADDPFALEGLIDELTILAWDPLFGALSAESSRQPKAGPA
jgi:uncharacterized protein YciI